MSRPAAAVWLLVAIFVGITVWWLSVDNRVPDWDNAKHLSYNLFFYDRVKEGDVLSPLVDYLTYPPLLYIVGMAGVAIGGISVGAPTLAENIVFVPLLAFGCYGAASIALKNKWAGVAAAAFALGSPLVITLFHAMMVDLPEAAMVAVSLWALLASDRFANRRWSAIAGLALGFGMLTKATFGFFVIGLILVMLLRGGWRNWRNVLIAAVVGLIVAAPWYVIHLDQWLSLADGAANSATSQTSDAASVFPKRWSSQDFGWYFWDLINQQLFLPLFVLFIAGTAAAVTGYVRRRERDDYTPELLVGGFVGYLIMTSLTLHDVRYTIPALPYVAVLGGGYLLRLPRPGRRFALAALAVVCLGNTAAVSFGAFGEKRIRFPGATNSSAVFQRNLTVVSNGGFLVGEPKNGGNIVEILRALKRQGINVVESDAAPGSTNPFFSPEGNTYLVRVAGVTRPPTYDPFDLRPNEAFLKVLPPGPDDGLCARLPDTEGVAVLVGNPPDAPRPMCPLTAEQRREALKP